LVIKGEVIFIFGDGLFIVEIGFGGYQFIIVIDRFWAWGKLYFSDFGWPG